MPYTGDKFGTRGSYTDGLLYMSRIGPNPAPRPAPRKSRRRSKVRASEETKVEDPATGTAARKAMSRAAELRRTLGLGNAQDSASLSQLSISVKDGDDLLLESAFGAALSPLTIVGRERRRLLETRGRLDADSCYSDAPTDSTLGSPSPLPSIDFTAPSEPRIRTSEWFHMNGLRRSDIAKYGIHSFVVSDSCASQVGLERQELDQQTVELSSLTADGLMSAKQRHTDVSTFVSMPDFLKADPVSTMFAMPGLELGETLLQRKARPPRQWDSYRHWSRPESRLTTIRRPHTTAALNTQASQRATPARPVTKHPIGRQRAKSAAQRPARLERGSPVQVPAASPQPLPATARRPTAQ